MASLDYVYRYPFASRVERGDGSSTLKLAAETAPDRPAALFEGEMLKPGTTAPCLRAVSDIVGTRFYVPPSMLARILRQADPVVTVGRERLHFEGFSECCSAYARHDLLPGSFEAGRQRHGTTNVDFGADMRAALAGVRTGETMSLSVDHESVAVEAAGETVIERKVRLPVRWIKGLAEVQAHLSGMTHRLSAGRIQAQRFLRALPRSASGDQRWVTSAGQGLRLAAREAAGAVPVRGVHRIRVLERLVAGAAKLDVWSNEALGSSAWVLDFETERFMLVLNAEPWRGFSGDGQLLSGLASPGEAGLNKARAALRWQSEISADDLAGLVGDDARSTLAHLAAGGQLGFDVCSGTWFHRALPFDLADLDALNPRMASARALVEKGAVRLTPDADGIAAEVSSDGVVHRVHLGADEARCTCPWYSKHRGRRGPCKHILAAEIVSEHAANE